MKAGRLLTWRESRRRPHRCVRQLVGGAAVLLAAAALCLLALIVGNPL